MKYWLIPIAGFLGGCYALIAVYWGNNGKLQIDESVVPLICGIALAACGASAFCRYFEIWNSFGRSSTARSCNAGRDCLIRICIFDDATDTKPPTMILDDPIQISDTHRSSLSKFVASERLRLLR